MNEDNSGAGYNVNQSKIAIGSGGLEGKGFLNGTQTKLKYVPEQDTDFIFCTVGEEQGFLGSAAVLLLFLAMILRLIYLSERQSTAFGRVYGYSVMSILLFHVFINIGMVTGLTPVIGIPLPFFSYGGSLPMGFHPVAVHLSAHRRRSQSRVSPAIVQFQPSQPRIFLVNPKLSQLTACSPTYTMLYILQHELQ